MTWKTRLATAQDASAIAAIYAPFVVNTAITFEYVPPDTTEFVRRIEAANERHAFLVAVTDQNDIIGYAYAGPYRARAAYRWSTEVSAYIARGAERCGVGRMLYEDLLERLRTNGYRTALAALTLPNPASAAFHEALGFAFIGRFANVGWKHGAWRDVGWWSLDLDPSAKPPLTEK